MPGGLVFLFMLLRERPITHLFLGGVMRASVKVLLLLYLSIISLHLISGYAWSGRLERSNDFSLVLLEEGAQDSFEEDVIEYTEDSTTLVSKSSNSHGERRQSAMVPGFIDLNCNRVFDTEKETDLREMYNIQ